MTKQELEAIRARCEAATNTALEIREREMEEYWFSQTLYTLQYNKCAYVVIVFRKEDAEFIAHPSDDMRTLLDAVCIQKNAYMDELRRRRNVEPTATNRKPGRRR